MSFQDRLRRAQLSDFIGRAGELALFCNNLDNPADQDLRSPLFSVHGAGGMGKTFLLGRLREAARGRGWLTAIVTDSIYEVVEVMGAIASQLERQGAKVSRFTKPYEAYDKKRRNPEGSGARTFVKMATQVTKGTVDTLLPGATTLTKAIDSEQVAETLVREDLRLVESPVDVLTPVFLKVLCEVDRPLALFFDTYERTGQYLDEWLRAIFEGTYGDAPLDMVITVAGREPLDPHLWSPYLSVLTEMPLAAFTEVEVRQFLLHGAVRDEDVIREINKVSRGLPLAVATLAKQRPSSPDSIKDNSLSLVRRFLQWVDDPAREDLALLAALPRQFDQDLVQVLVDGDATELYHWLRGQSFVSRDGGICIYHEVVREPMLRLSRSSSPQRWSETHTKLAIAYKERRQRIGLTAGSGWKNAEWRSHLVEECYHRLCADSHGELSVVLDYAVRAAGEGLAVARRWADVIVAAGADCDISSVQELGRRMRGALTSDDGLGDYLDLLIRHPDMPTEALHKAYFRRGMVEYDAGRLENSLVFFSRAATLDPEYELAFAFRAETYRRLHRYEEALIDFDKALELESNDAWNFLGRAKTLDSVGRSEDAIADANRAVELEPNNAWYITQRGTLFQDHELHDEALADFSTALTLDPNDTWVLDLRVLTYIKLEDYDKALADVDRLLELYPEKARYRELRSMVLFIMGRYEEVLNELVHFLDIEPENVDGHERKGRSLRMLSQMEAAASAFEHAISLTSEPANILRELGKTKSKQGRYLEAVDIFSSAVAVAANAETLGARAEAYRLLGRVDDALADFNASLALKPDDPWTLGHRAVAYRARGDRQKAVDDLTRALELAPYDDSFVLERVMTCGVSLTEGHDYQWVADLDAVEGDAHMLAQAAKEWMIQEGLIEAKRVSCEWEENGIHRRRETKGLQRATGVSFSIGRVICYPMKGESAACPTCGFRTLLHDNGIATAHWDKFVVPIYEWVSGGSLDRTCEECGQCIHLNDWHIREPWAFTHLALRFWNWPTLTSEFLATLSEKLGRHRLKLISGRR